MKKFLALAIITLIILDTIQSTVFAAESNLVEDIQLSLKATETPNRLLLSFDLSESIDLSQENSNIIIEYFAKDSNENLETTNYIKEKSWSGYLNSYDNYPSGERKYSSGYTNENYSDQVPAARIYTSTKTGTKIDVAKVAAVKITVLRADGSGESILVDNGGNILDFEEIEALDNNEIEIPVIDQELGVKIYSASLPEDTVLVAKEVTSGSVYEIVSSIFAEAKRFITIDITLELNGAELQPNGEVEVSIPIPENINSSNVAVYRIDNNGAKIPYQVTITRTGEIEYATFLTDHFSTYVLAEVVQEGSGIVIQNGTDLKAGIRTERETAKGELFSKTEETLTEKKEQTEENKIPITGRAQILNHNMAIIVLIIGILLKMRLPTVPKA